MPTRHTHSLSVLFGLEGVKFLLLEGSGLAEGEGDGVGGQLSVGVSHSVNTLADGGLIEWVKEDGLGALSVDGNTGVAASDAAWLHNVVKNGVLDGFEGAGTGSLLGSVVDRYIEN